MKSANKKNRKNLSITTRLTLFYSFTIVTLIAVVILFLYASMLNTLHHANSEFLFNEVEILQKLIKKNNNCRIILEHKVIEVPSTKTGSVYNYFIRILDDNNKVVIETPGMKKNFQQAEFFNPKFLSSQEVSKWHSAEKTYLLIRAPAIHTNLKRWQIQIALDISYQQVLLHKWNLILLAVLLLITKLALMLGYFITRNGLKSLYLLTKKTKDVTASSLHHKLDPELWPAELKTLGIAFNDMLARIEKSFVCLNQFSDDLAHELRTPINNIMGQTEILLSQVATLDQYQNLLGSNLEELQRISQIIDNLLFLARAENHEIDFSKTTLNVAEEIKLICDFYQPLAEEKNINLSVVGDGEVVANSTMFRRMISNILSNGIKYSLVGGSVNIKINENEDQTHIAVHDNGVGIAPEHIPYVFDRFYRTDSARSHESGGTGLGLAIVKSIVELHQGEIALQSVPYQGTSIFIAIPKKSPLPYQERGTSPPFAI